MEVRGEERGGNPDKGLRLKKVKELLLGQLGFNESAYKRITIITEQKREKTAKIHHDQIIPNSDKTFTL